MKDSDLIRIGAEHALPAIAALEGAAIDQCEAFPPTPTGKPVVDYVRCTSPGVLIRETDMRDNVRHRFVCPKHGYDPKHTTPVPKDQR